MHLFNAIACFTHRSVLVVDDAADDIRRAAYQRTQRTHRLLLYGVIFEQGARVL